jgi:hypothetical protein
MSKSLKADELEKDLNELERKLTNCHRMDKLTCDAETSDDKYTATNCYWSKKHEKCTPTELLGATLGKHKTYKDLLSPAEIDRIIKSGTLGNAREKIELAKQVEALSALVDGAKIPYPSNNYVSGQNVTTMGNVDLQYRNQVVGAQRKRMYGRQRKMLNDYNVVNDQLRDQINARLDHEQYILKNIHTLLSRHNTLANDLVPRHLENLAYSQNALNPLLSMFGSSQGHMGMKGGRKMSRRTKKNSKRKSSKRKSSKRKSSKRKSSKRKSSKRKSSKRKSRKSKGGNMNGARISLGAAPFI